MLCSTFDCSLKLVDLRTWVYPKYFAIGFTDFTIIWHCTLGSRIYTTTNNKQSLLICLPFQSQGPVSQQNPGAGRDSVTHQGHLSRVNVGLNLPSD